MEALGLDIKLLAVQIINFGLLVFILSKFVYKPIIKLLDERKKKVQESMDNTLKIEERLSKLEEKEKDILKKAQEKANEEREELSRLAKEEKEQILDEARSAAEKETLKGVERIKAAEEEASQRIKEKFVKKITDEVVNRFTASTKDKNNYPLLKQILK